MRHYFHPSTDLVNHPAPQSLRVISVVPLKARQKVYKDQDNLSHHAAKVAEKVEVGGVLQSKERSFRDWVGQNHSQHPPLCSAFLPLDRRGD